MSNFRNSQTLTKQTQSSFNDLISFSVCWRNFCASIFLSHAVLLTGRKIKIQKNTNNPSHTKKKTKKKKKTLRQIPQKLTINQEERKASRLFSPPPLTSCTTDSTALDSTVLKPTLMHRTHAATCTCETTVGVEEKRKESDRFPNCSVFAWSGSVIVPWLFSLSVLF